MKINVIGDSHTQAIGPRLTKLLPGVRWQAFPGYSTQRVIGALDLAALWPKPDLTIVLLGGNDFGDQSRRRLDLLAMIPGGPVLWVGPGHSEVADVDARHRAQAESQRAQFQDAHTIVWMNSRPFTDTGHVRDGTHFTGHQYDVIAKAVADRAERMLPGESSASKTTAVLLLVLVVGGVLAARKLFR